MAFLKKNIWLGFQLVTIIWLTLFIGATYVSYNNVYDDVEHQLESLTKTNANSIKAVLQKYEVILDLLSVEMAHYDYTITKTPITNLIDSIMTIDNSLLAIGIFDVNGVPLLANSSTPLEEEFNLLKLSVTRATFLHTLQVERPVIGRTYFVDSLQKFVIPIRKAVRNENGDVVFVLTLALDMHKEFNFLSSNNEDIEIFDTYIFRDFDRFFMLAPTAKIYDEESYEVPIPEESVKQGLSALISQLPFTLEEIKEKELVVTHQSQTPQGYGLVASTYFNEYQLWLSTNASLDTVKVIFLKKVLFLVTLFLTSLGIIFALFKKIADAEKKKQTALSFQATHDFLTNIHNRFFLKEQELHINQCSSPYVVFLINLDRFKSINEKFGHDIGDRVLCEISTRLTDYKSSNDILVRYGSDEFLIVSYSAAVDDLNASCARLSKVIKQPFPWKDIQFEITTSIGISSYPQDGNSLSNIISNADLALHEAKKCRDSYVVYTNTLKAQLAFRLQVERELKTALVNNELYMVYQPQIKHDGQLHGVEALIRWENKSLGNIPPFKFIPIAESLGIMPSLGLFILRESIRQVIEICQKTHKDINLSVNISVSQFMQPDFYHHVESALKEFGFTPNHLVLEITESMFIEDVQKISRVIDKLKTLGVKISLDDFGTGYSSLSSLKELAIDELKIDKSFVDDIGFDEDARSMIKGILTISENLAIETVAEGIENIEQLTLLKAMNCSIYQGYYFSKPLNIDALYAFLENVQTH